MEGGRDVGERERERRETYLRRSLHGGRFHNGNEALILHGRVLGRLGHTSQEGEAGGALAAGGASSISFQPGVDAIGVEVVSVLTP